MLNERCERVIFFHKFSTGWLSIGAVLLCTIRMIVYVSRRVLGTLCAGVFYGIAHDPRDSRVLWCSIIVDTGLTGREGGLGWDLVVLPSHTGVCRKGEFVTKTWGFGFFKILFFVF